MQAPPDVSGTAPAATPAADPAATSGDSPGEIDVSPTSLVERADALLDAGVRLLPNLALALLVLLLGYSLAMLARKLVRGWAFRRGREELGRVAGGFAFAGMLALFSAFALTVLAPSLSIGSLVGSLGIGSIAVGFAFKDILQNWLAGLLILVRRPFHIGDQIEVASFEGTVEHIQTRATLIRTYDGQRVVIPNADVYTNAVIVRTAEDIRRTHYDVGVGYSTDLDTAREIALTVMGDTPGVLADPAPEALPWEVNEAGTVLRLRWWTDSQRASVVRARASVIRGIKAAYDSKRIDIPYETRVVMLREPRGADGDADTSPKRRTTF